VARVIQQFTEGLWRSLPTLLKEGKEKRGKRGIGVLFSLFAYRTPATFDLFQGRGGKEGGGVLAFSRRFRDMRGDISRSKSSLRWRGKRKKKRRGGSKAALHSRFLCRRDSEAFSLSVQCQIVDGKTKEGKEKKEEEGKV